MGLLLPIFFFFFFFFNKKCGLLSDLFMANGLIKSFYIKYFQFSDFMSGLKHHCYTIAPLGNTSLLTVDASGSVFPLAGSFLCLFCI